MIDKKSNKSYGTGRRKTSVARVFLTPGGKGNIEVNGKDYKTYFPAYYLDVIETPMVVTDQMGKWDVYCTIKGGGVAGQAEALRHGISRALDDYSRDQFHKLLKVAGLLTRDDRMVERKKVGLRKARKREQYSKR